MKFELSAEQQKIINHKNSCVILGVPGSGKTCTLIEKAAALTKAGHSVAVVGFAWRSIQFMRNLYLKNHPDLQGKVTFGTIKDLAQQSLEESAEPIVFADNSRVRTYIRQAMEQENFHGSLEEAEHIIRTFRSRLKNPKETERYYPLFAKYKEIIDAAGFIDRHTIIRKHIIGMDNGTVTHCKYKYILVDNIQDATALQHRWLQAHLLAGSVLIMAGNDDLTTFTADGALGIEVFRKFDTNQDIKRFNLVENHRIPNNILPAISKLPRLLKDRLPKKEVPCNKNSAKLDIQNFGDIKSEMSQLCKQVQSITEANSSARVGIILRNDEQAARVTHLLRLHGLKPASYARLIWENWGAQVVINILYVILNQAKNDQLYSVFAAFGVPLEIQAQLAEQGLEAQNWLVKGAPVSVELKGDIQKLSNVRRNLLGIWKLLAQRKITPPEAFKAVVHDLLPNLEESDRRFALLALDMLLNIKGKLVDSLPTIQQEIMPDMESKIIVALVKEIRNMEFDVLFIPFAEDGQWPDKTNQTLGVDEDSERRQFYLAASCCKGDIFISYVFALSPYVKEMQISLKMHKEPNAAN